jgi:hypothetical protein
LVTQKSERSPLEAGTRGLVKESRQFCCSELQTGCVKQR